MTTVTMMPYIIDTPSIASALQIVKEYEEKGVHVSYTIWNGTNTVHLAILDLVDLPIQK
jgi:hypothetical protein